MMVVATKHIELVMHEGEHDVFSSSASPIWPWPTTTRRCGTSSWMRAASS